MNSSSAGEVADPCVELPLGLVLVAKEKEGGDNEGNKAWPECTECCHCYELVERDCKEGCHKEEDLSAGYESSNNPCALPVCVSGHFLLDNEF